MRKKDATDESKLRSQLRAYGLCNERDFDTIESQASDDQKKKIEDASDRSEIQSVLSQLAAENGMNTDNPKTFVHP